MTKLEKKAIALAREFADIARQGWLTSRFHEALRELELLEDLVD